MKKKKKQYECITDGSLNPMETESEDLMDNFTRTNVDVESVSEEEYREIFD
jgi:hypothetical protein